ncbi:MAG: mechanosensitive ion channel family protein [Candidatus Thermoplasmatota archaeon]|nr:mechanosensitive ion channel family protein [Candidatus Thermoplasmatota archaeon]
MDIIDALLREIEPYSEILQIIVVILIAFIIFSIIHRIIKGRLLRTVKTKKQRTNITVFLDMLKYLFAVVIFLIVISFYSGKLGDLGFFAGLLSVALGWALQKPISGVVAWLILVLRRPFQIGDRVIISGITGDVTNITLTHIILDEVGGTIDGEESSGRTIIIPTSAIFEQHVINYTERDDYILDEVPVSITYESDLEHAEHLITTAFEKSMKPYWEFFPKRVKKESHIRLKFQASGIEVILRYYTFALKRNQIATAIRKEIWKAITAAPTVDFAYPHTEVIMQKQ